MQPSSSSPSLAEGVLLAIDGVLSDVHTCMPGVVVNYNATKQTATVLPSFKRVYEGEVVVALPKLYNVPVRFPSTKTAHLLLPLAAGDEVELHFSERGLDDWKAQGGQVDPGVPHKFSLSDAVCTPGLRSGPNAIVAKGAPTSIELALGAVWLEITNTGQVKLSNGVFDVIQALNTFATTSSTATTAPQIAAAAATLATALASFAGI